MKNFTTTSERENESWLSFFWSAVGAKPRRGFTLLETLVAVAVLLMALLGPFAIAQQSLKSAYYARDQVTAFYLAQEGIEFVRALRDENYLNGVDWMTGVGTTCTVATPCTIDFPNFAYEVCTGGCEPLQITDSGGLFNHGSGSEVSKFTRKLTLIPIDGFPEDGVPDQMIVSVTISWTSAGVPRVFTLQERLFNWL